MKIELKEGERYYATVKSGIDLNDETIEMEVELRGPDVRRILREAKKLPAHLSTDVPDEASETYRIHIYLGDIAYIKIVDTILYVKKDNVLQILKDKRHNVRVSVLSQMQKKDYNRMTEITETLFENYYPEYTQEELNAIRKKHEEWLKRQPEIEARREKKWMITSAKAMAKRKIINDRKNARRKKSEERRAKIENEKRKMREKKAEERKRIKRQKFDEENKKRIAEGKKPRVWKEEEKFYRIPRGETIYMLRPMDKIWHDD